MDVAFFYQLGKRYNFALNVSNALDRAYFSYVASNNNVHPGDPRKITTSVTVSF